MQQARAVGEEQAAEEVRNLAGGTWIGKWLSQSRRQGRDSPVRKDGMERSGAVTRQPGVDSST